MERLVNPNRPQEFRKGRIAKTLVVNISPEAFRSVLVVKLT